MSDMIDHTTMPTDHPDAVATLHDELVAREEPFVIATVVRTLASVAAKPGAKAIITADGRMAGWVGGGCGLGAVKAAAKRCLEDGEARLISVMPYDQLQAQGLKPGDRRDGIEFAKNMCPSRGVLDVFVEPVLPRPLVMVCGATPVAVALADLAPRIGLKVEVCAPAAMHGAFPAGTRLRDGVVALSENRAGSYLIIATQGSGDEDGLRAALNSPARYVAFIGSRAKVAALKQRLADGGIPADRLDDLRGPAGLAIGAVTPEEIALSVLADVVQVRRQGAAQRQNETHHPDATLATAAVPSEPGSLAPKSKMEAAE
jgi:xanthine dehydrogenase accessory factor